MRQQGKMKKRQQEQKKRGKNSVPGTSSDGSQTAAAVHRSVAIFIPQQHAAAQQAAAQQAAAQLAAASGSVRSSNKNKQHQHQHRQQQQLLLYQHQHRQQQQLLLLLFSILGPASLASCRVLLLLLLLLSRWGEIEMIRELSCCRGL